jgi:hypothetical protein
MKFNLNKKLSKILIKIFNKLLPLKKCKKLYIIILIIIFLIKIIAFKWIYHLNKLIQKKINEKNFNFIFYFF